MYLFQVMNMTMRTAWSSEAGTADPWPSGCSEVRRYTILQSAADALSALRFVSQSLLTLHRVTLHEAL